MSIISQDNTNEAAVLSHLPKNQISSARRKTLTRDLLPAYITFKRFLCIRIAAISAKCT